MKIKKGGVKGKFTPTCGQHGNLTKKTLSYGNSSNCSTQWRPDLSLNWGLKKFSVNPRDHYLWAFTPKIKESR